MRRWPAFSLVEMAIVLMITGLLLTGIPALMKFHKTLQTQQQMDLAIKSLGAYVAQNFPLPEPAPPRNDEEFILRGSLPYKKLGIKRRGPVIRYAVDRALTEDKSRVYINFCKTDFKNRFDTGVSTKNDLIAFELSVDKIKIAITRNNFAAQYCGMVCKAPEPEKKEEEKEKKASSTQDQELIKEVLPTEETGGDVSVKKTPELT